MANVEGQDYKFISWVCPQCDTNYPSKMIGIHNPNRIIPNRTDRFCERGCGRSFDEYGREITRALG